MNTNPSGTRSFRIAPLPGVHVNADVVEGRELEAAVQAMFADPDVNYLQAHNARPGCCRCRIDRAHA